MRGSTWFLTSWPTHRDTELKEWLMFLLTHAAWCPVLSGEHLSGEASGHQALTFQRMRFHGPASPSPELWTSSSPGKARGQFHSFKLGNTCLALPLGRLGKRYRIEAGLSEATWAKQVVQPKAWIPSHSPWRGQDNRQRSNWLEDKTETQTDATLCKT